MQSNTTKRPAGYKAQDLTISQMAWLKILTLKNMTTRELAGMCILSETDPLHIVDVVLVKHYADTARFEFDPDALADFQSRMAQDGVTPDRCMTCYVHTHPGSGPGSAEPSTTDWSEFRDFAQGRDFAIMFIVSQGRQVTATLRMRLLEENHPTFGSIYADTRLDVKVVNQFAGYPLFLSLDECPADLLAQLPLQEWVKEHEETAFEYHKKWNKGGYYQGNSQNQSYQNSPANNARGGGTQTSQVHGPHIPHHGHEQQAPGHNGKAQKKSAIIQISYEEATRDLNPLLTLGAANIDRSRLYMRLGSNHDVTERWWKRREAELRDFRHNAAALKALSQGLTDKATSSAYDVRRDAFRELYMRVRGDYGKATLVWDFIMDEHEGDVTYGVPETSQYCEQTLWPQIPKAPAPAQPEPKPETNATNIRPGVVPHSSRADYFYNGVLPEVGYMQLCRLSLDKDLREEGGVVISTHFLTTEPGEGSSKVVVDHGRIARRYGLDMHNEELLSFLDEDELKAAVALLERRKIANDLRVQSEQSPVTEQSPAQEVAAPSEPFQGHFLG